MRVITAEEIRKNLRWEELVEALARAHREAEIRQGDLMMNEEGNTLLARGAWMPGDAILVKAVTIFPANSTLEPPLPSVQGAVFLFNGRNGGLDAIIDGEELTAWKTAGDSALGVKLLAREDAGTMTVIGAGTVAQACIRAHRAVRPSIERVLIYNRTGAKAEALAEECRAEGIQAEAASDPETAVRTADILTTATASREPVFKGEWLKPGAHVDLIGAFTPEMREADDAAILRSRIFMDSRDTVFAHCGDLLTPLKSGLITEADVQADLYDLCAGAEGRRSAEEITLFKNGGGAHLDLMTAREIYRACS